MPTIYIGERIIILFVSTAGETILGIEVMIFQNFTICFPYKLVLLLNNDSTLSYLHRDNFVYEVS